MLDSILIRPIRRRKLYQEVAESLELLIHNGALGEGDALPSERELMERFDVGRPAVREALMSLEKSGLVVLSSGERARVSRPTTAHMLRELTSAAKMMLADESGIRHFQSARCLFEVALARRAARQATPDDIVELRGALDRNLAARGDAVAFQRSDVAFHYEIARIAGNPLLLGLHEALTEWLLEQRTVSLRDRNAEAHAADFHTRVFDAIAAHNPDAAEEAMESHLNITAKLYWKVAKTGVRPVTASSSPATKRRNKR